jgi:hypothetical protein
MQKGQFLLIRGLVGCWLFLGAVLAGAQPLETDDHRMVLANVQRLVDRYGADQVLVTYDYDDTIAASQEYLASEVWFNDEASRLRRGESHLDGVTTYDELIQLQNLIFHHFPPRLVQPELPAIVRQIQQMGVHVLVVTSRNYAFFDGLRSDLERFGLNFAGAAIGPAGGYEAPYPLRDPKTGLVAGLSQEETDRYLKPTADNDVLFRDGIYLTGGKHKGAALRGLLARTGSHPQALLSIDDRLYHLEGIQDAFAGTGVETVTIRYTRQDAVREIYEKMDPAQVERAVNVLEKLLQPKEGIPCADSLAALVSLP